MFFLVIHYYTQKHSEDCLNFGDLNYEFLKMSGFPFYPSMMYIFKQNNTTTIKLIQTPRSQTWLKVR